MREKMSIDYNSSEKTSKKEKLRSRSFFQKTKLFETRIVLFTLNIIILNRVKADAIQ